MKKYLLLYIYFFSFSHYSMPKVTGLGLLFIIILKLMKVAK